MFKKRVMILILLFSFISINSEIISASKPIEPIIDICKLECRNLAEGHPQFTLSSFGCTEDFPCCDVDSPKECPFIDPFVQINGCEDRCLLDRYSFMNAQNPPYTCYASAADEYCTILPNSKPFCKCVFEPSNLRCNKPEDCNDDNDCTQDSCDLAHNTCSYNSEPMDGQGCTTLEGVRGTCRGGKCKVDTSHCNILGYYKDSPLHQSELPIELTINGHEKPTINIIGECINEYGRNTQCIPGIGTSIEELELDPCPDGGSQPCFKGIGTVHDSIIIDESGTTCEDPRYCRDGGKKYFVASFTPDYPGEARIIFNPSRVATPCSVTVKVEYEPCKEERDAYGIVRRCIDESGTYYSQCSGVAVKFKECNPNTHLCEQRLPQSSVWCPDFKDPTYSENKIKCIKGNEYPEPDTASVEAPLATGLYHDATCGYDYCLADQAKLAHNQMESNFQEIYKNYLDEIEHQTQALDAEQDTLSRATIKAKIYGLAALSSIPEKGYLNFGLLSLNVGQGLAITPRIRSAYRSIRSFPTKRLFDLKTLKDSITLLKKEGKIYVANPSTEILRDCRDSWINPQSECMMDELAGRFVGNKARIHVYDRISFKLKKVLEGPLVITNPRGGSGWTTVSHETGHYIDYLKKGVLGDEAPGYFAELLHAKSVGKYAFKQTKKRLIKSLPYIDADHAEGIREALKYFAKPIPQVTAATAQSGLARAACTVPSALSTTFDGNQLDCGGCITPRREIPVTWDVDLGTSLEPPRGTDSFDRAMENIMKRLGTDNTLSSKRIDNNVLWLDNLE